MTPNQTPTRHSPAPWTYDYNPYRLQDGSELPAFEVFDAEQDKIFDTNEDSPEELQEANARLASHAPCLRDALRECLRLLADFEEAEGDEGEVYPAARDILAECE